MFLPRLLLLFGLTLSAPTFGQNSDFSKIKDSQGIIRCGTFIDDASIQAQEARFQASGVFPPSDTERRRPASIRVHYHVIYENRTLEKGYVPRRQIRAQNEVLDNAFASSPTGINFHIGSINHYRNATWFNSAGNTSPLQDDMKKKLRKGGKADLNVYTVGFTTVGGLLGYSTYPWSYAEKPWDDGVVIHYSTLPNGTIERYNLGATLVHEVGHWVGLYHTFENGCEKPGDFVRDTPSEASPAFGCPINRDTCEGGGVDPVTNYMDYSDDSCLTGFTKGQGNRTAGQLLTYRGIRTGFTSLDSL